MSPEGPWSTPKVNQFNIIKKINIKQKKLTKLITKTPKKKENKKKKK